MLSRVRDFLLRHRRKFIVTGVVVGGTFFALRYAQRKLIEFQEQKAREFFEKTRRLQHFESTERTCNQVIIGMGAELCSAIIRECSTDALLEQLRQNPENKLELWEEMKIISFTRLTTLIYASSMLVVTLRVQLNVLGGYLYRDITTDQKQISDQLKEQYLSLIRYFLQEGGLVNLVRLIRTKVMNIMKSMPLGQRFSLADLEQLFWSMQMSINGDEQGDPNTKMTKYMLPAQLPTEYEIYGTSMQRIFNETLDLLESDDASVVCASNVCRGFSLAMDAIAESVGETVQLSNGNNSGLSKPTAAATTTETKFATTDNLLTTTTATATTASDGFEQNFNQSNHLPNLNSIEMALAKIIPIVSGLTCKGFDTKSRPQNLATSLITFYVVAEKCKMFGANVYESFATS